MSSREPPIEQHGSRSSEVSRRLAGADRHVMLSRERLRTRLSLHQPRQIAAYRGVDDGRVATLAGRVLADGPALIPEDDHDWFDNLVNTYRRFRSRYLADVELRVEYGGHQALARSDADGYYEIELPSPAFADDAWVQARVSLADESLVAEQPVLRVPQASGIGIISDIDDTILHSGINDWRTVAQLTFLHNARTRKPLPGVAALYAALQAGGSGSAKHPVFYVSSSPWNLYDLLDDFMDLNEIPPGPIFLRDVRTFFGPGGHEHKLERTRSLIQRMPQLRWVLMGDSGQDDAELYAEAAREFGERIAAVYIRDVEPDAPSRRDGGVDRHIESIAGTGVPMLRVVDSTEVARHAASLGLVCAAAMAEVAADVELDRERPSVGEAAVDEALTAGSRS